MIRRLFSAARSTRRSRSARLGRPPSVGVYDQYQHMTDPAVPRPRRSRALFVGVALVAVAIVLISSGTARAAWQEIARYLSLVGDPEPASANVLSEHEIEVLDEMTPSQQAELLLERFRSRRESRRAG